MPNDATNQNCTTPGAVMSTAKAECKIHLAGSRQLAGTLTLQSFEDENDDEDDSPTPEDLSFHARRILLPSSIAVIKQGK